MDKNEIDLVMGLIPLGHNNTVSREFLSDCIGCSDRSIRKTIQDSKSRDFEPGNLVINLGNGYFRPDINDPEDDSYIDAFVRIETARAMSILSGLKPYKQYVNQASQMRSNLHQINMFEVLGTKELLNNLADSH